MLIFGTRGFTQTDTQVVVFRCPSCGNYRHGICIGFLVLPMN